MNDHIELFGAAPEKPEPIPEMKGDIAHIGKMPTQPRPYNGWETQEFKNEFDRAGIEIQTYLNTILIPALIAGRIPYRSSVEVPANDVQTAIEAVQRQIKAAATGAIPNGAVTAEKLSAELLRRTFGGVPWIALDPPGNVGFADGYPIGQEWVTPRFVVKNKAEYSPGGWTVSNASVSVSGEDIVITGLSQTATMEAKFSPADFGSKGDRMYALFTLADVDPEITEVKMSINQWLEDKAITAGDIVAVESAGDSFTFKVTAAWPAASIANGSITLKNLTIVNIDEILRQFPGINEAEDWAAYIKSLMPFRTKVSNFAGWIQVADKQWSQEVFETLPLSRGGTGRTSYAPGQMLYVGEDGTLNPIEKPSAPALLEMGMGGVPEWREKTKLTEELGLLRIKTGTYQGTGQERTIELPVTPKLLYIQCDEGPIQSGSGSPLDNPFVLGDGGERIETARGYIDGGSAAYTVNASLKKNGLSFSHGPTFTDNPQTYLGNRQSCNYTWLALY